MPSPLRHSLLHVHSSPLSGLLPRALSRPPPTPMRRESRGNNVKDDHIGGAFGRFSHLRAGRMAQHEPQHALQVTSINARSTIYAKGIGRSHAAGAVILWQSQRNKTRYKLYIALKFTSTGVREGKMRDVTLRMRIKNYIVGRYSHDEVMNIAGHICAG
ncbi:hypothetical protein B0H11DRAFT_1905987 [Mycena galericulata]|nr:hypothetical protein B0H11DRAFT_1905987 [Mycena galericulata]